MEEERRNVAGNEMEFGDEVKTCFKRSTPTCLLDMRHFTSVLALSLSLYEDVGVAIETCAN